MSEQSGQLPGDIVKVEVEEDDERSGGNSSDTVEGDDKDMEMLKDVASLLSNGPWLSCETDAGESLVGKLLSLGENLVGWKEWERLRRMKEKENRELAQRLKAAESQFEMVGESKFELRTTYDLEVERRIKAEREVAELRKKIVQKSGTEVSQEVNLKTDSEVLLRNRGGNGEGNINKLQLAKEADCGWREREDKENGGISTDSDDGESETDSENDVGHRSCHKPRRKNAQKPTTQVLPVVPMQTTASSDPGTSTRVPKLADSSLLGPTAGSPENEDSGSYLSNVTGSSVEDMEGGDEAVSSVSCEQGRQGATCYLRQRSSRSGAEKATEGQLDSKAPDEDNDDPTVPPRRNRDSGGVSNGGDKRFQCERCGAVLAFKRGFNQHMKEVHGVREERGTFHCYCCNEQFLYKSMFRQHMRGHPEEQSYSCKTCGKISKSKNIHRIHQKTHDPDRKKTFTCPTCSNTFFTSAHLANHLKVHSVERPYKCPRCPQAFKLAKYFRQHLAVHSELKPFQCELCEKKFKRSCELEKHMRVHTGERPYSCDICKKRFTQSCTLKNHTRTHQGDEGKIYPCPYCNKKFSRSPTCLLHQQRRHKSSAAAELGGLKEKGRVS